MSKVTLLPIQEVGQPIEFPNIAELLRMPIFSKVSPEELRKYGSDFQKTLLDNVPLRHKSKHIAIYSFVHMLHPGIRTNILKLNGIVENEWHVDRDPDAVADSTYHIIMNDCSARTKFSNHSLEVGREEYYGGMDLIRILNCTDKYKIDGEKAKPFCFHTFNQYTLHCSTTAERREFRFFFRVLETDFISAMPFEEMTLKSVAYSPNGSYLDSVVASQDEIKIYTHSDRGRVI